MGGEPKQRKIRAAAVPVDLLLATGEKAQRVGDTVRAEQAYRRVLDADPCNPSAVQMLGAILVVRGDVDEAVELFEGAAARLGEPALDTIGFFNNYANALRHVGRLPSAESILRALIAIAPRDWEPWHNLGQTLRDLERYDEAAAAMRRAVMLNPDFAANHGVLGEILHRLGRLHSAEVALQRCADLGCVDDANLWTTIGANQRLLGQLDVSVETLQKALALAGGTSAAHSNLGVVLQQMGRFDESIRHFDAALALEPDDHKLHGYLGYTLLAAGDLDAAWPEWEHGVQGGPRGVERPVGKPRWTPADPDARVLVYREQGVGDEIMFASCYPDVIAAARSVVIECDPRVTTLFARSFPGAEVRAQTCIGLTETCSDFDAAIPAGSLPMHFRRSLSDFPDRRAFLAPDSDLVAEWRERLEALGPRPYIGVSWRSKVQTAERRLEYTRLDEWAPVFAQQDATFVNLQYHEAERELRDAESRFRTRIHRWEWLDLMNDFDAIAALTAALDLVIAPHNAVAMLTGALGVRGLVMGTGFGWPQLGTDRLPWFPSLELSSRLAHESWDDVIAVAAARVAETIEHLKAPV